MSKLSLTDLVNLQNETSAVTSINSNNAAVIAAFENNLSRNGTQPNHMEANLDMNSNRILNLPAATTDVEPVRLEEFNRALFDATTVVLSYGLSNGLNFDTRAAAQATAIPAAINYITISKYATGYPRCDAPYVRGGTVIPLTDALGGTWGLDLTSGDIPAYWFGVKADGVTDDYAVFQTVVNNCSGKNIKVNGRVGVSGTINLVSNTNISGTNPSSGFIVLGTNSLGQGIFNAYNVSSIKFNNITFIGNAVEPVAFSSGAVRILADAAGTGISGISITSCKFANFKTTEWIGVYLTADAFNTNRISDINISNNSVEAAGSCATTNAQSGVNGNTFVRLTANTLATTATTGDIYDVVFANNNIFGLGLSGAIAGFAYVHDVSVTGNVTTNMGNNTIAVDRSYTYLFYDTNAIGLGPDCISIVGNSGYGHHNNAVYLVGATNSIVSDNAFRFVYTGGLEPTLPWGAVVSLNGVQNTSVTNNILVDGLGGVAVTNISTPDTGSSNTCVIANNTIQNSFVSVSAQSPYGILLSGGTGTTDSLVGVYNNVIKVTGSPAASGILINGANLGNIKINGNLIESVYSGIQTSGTLVTKRLEMSNNVVYGAMTNYAMDITINTGPVFMNNNVADFSQVVAGSSGGVRINGPEFYVSGLSLYKKTNTGAALTSNSATGTLTGVIFPKTTSTYVDAGGLGDGIPVHSGRIGDFVQAVVPAEAGSAASKYVNIGWVNLAGNTVWTPQRMLTGN